MPRLPRGHILVPPAPFLVQLSHLWCACPGGPMLFHPLDALLGTTAKVRLLRVLLPLDSPVTGREAQRLARVRSTVGTTNALDELTALGILIRGGTPTTHQYRVNREHDLEPTLRALFQVEGKRMGVLRRVLEEMLDRAGVRDAVRSVVLFGSQARHDARPDSDLDVLFIPDGYEDVAAVEGAVADAAVEVHDRLGLRLAGIVIAAGRARERLREGDPLMEAVRAEGRPLLGEPFEEVVKRW